MTKTPKDTGRVDGPAPEPKRKGGRRSPASQDWLGKQLRDLYGRYTEEPLPDELKSLLDRLDDSKTDPTKKDS
jgi:hypothetical protein